MGPFPSFLPPFSLSPTFSPFLFSTFFKFIHKKKKKVRSQTRFWEEKGLPNKRLPNKNKSSILESLLMTIMLSFTLTNKRLQGRSLPLIQFLCLFGRKILLWRLTSLTQRRFVLAFVNSFACLQTLFRKEEEKFPLLSHYY